jgi:hypothetical protein
MGERREGGREGGREEGEGRGGRREEGEGREGKGKGKGERREREREETHSSLSSLLTRHRGTSNAKGDHRRTTRLRPALHHDLDCG